MIQCSKVFTIYQLFWVFSETVAKSFKLSDKTVIFLLYLQCFVYYIVNVTVFFCYIIDVTVFLLYYTCNSLFCYVVFVTVLSVILYM